jgi:CubicO group peptidase (beta-lactamase class C family)
MVNDDRKGRDMTSGSLHGQLDARFEPLRDLLESHLSSGAECGLSLVVDVDGRTVADVHGGFADRARTRTWGPDTIVNVWSTTKTVTSLAMLMLADRGLVNLDAPAARYWPEFAQQGKAGVLVRHLMSHTSGVAGWDKPCTIADVCEGPELRPPPGRTAPRDGGLLTWWRARRGRGSPADLGARVRL